MAAFSWPVGRATAAVPAQVRFAPAGGGSDWSTWAILSGAMLLAVVAGLMAAVGAGNMAIMLVIAVVLAGAGLFDYRIIVFALIIMFPLTSTHFFPRKLFGVYGLNPFNLLFFFGLVSFSLRHILALRKGVSRLPSPLFFWPLIFALCSAAIIGSRTVHLIPPSYYLNTDTYRTSSEYLRQVLVKPLFVLGFIYLIAAGVSTSRRKALWVWPVLVGGAGVALMIIFYVGASGVGLRALAETSSRSFLTPTGMHANELGVALIPLLSVSLFILPALSRLRSQFLSFVICVIALCGIALTFSRAAFLGTVIVGLAFALKRKRPAWIFIALIAVVTVMLFSPESVKNRVTRSLEFGSIGNTGPSGDPLTAGRMNEVWLPMLPELKDHALFGNGIDAMMRSLAAQKGLVFATHPHNAYYRLALDYGIFFGAFILLYLWRIWALWRNVARDPTVDPVLRAFFDGICVAFLAFLAQCMSGSSLVFDAPHALYLYSIGVGLGISASFSKVGMKAVAAEFDSGHRRLVSAD